MPKHDQQRKTPQGVSLGRILSGEPAVVIVDRDRERASRITAALRQLEPLTEFEPDVARIVGRLGKSSKSVVVIGLSEKPAPGLPELSVIHEVSGTGSTVIAYGDGVHTWDLRARCLPLLAGVTRLIDAREESFSVDLAGAVRSLIEGICARNSEEREIRTAMDQLGIIGVSKSMLELFRTLLRFTLLSDLPTLITGETGTGKERFARALHQLDPKRSRGPFVPVNCGALTSTLAESELFGHRRGSFTGADRNRRGLIRAAQGGVLFLDEVGELPESIQTKLLRVLQEGQVLTVGEEREEPVDVRIVAATNRDLAQRIRQGVFRPDLLHRLNVLALHIPPLRQRREDIRPLVSHFVQRHAASFGRSCPQLTDEAVEALEKLELPGNVRQLENIIRQALANHNSMARLQLSDLPSEVWREVVTEPNEQTSSPLPEPAVSQNLEVQIRRPFVRLIELTEGRLDHSLEFCERILITLVHERANGNQSEMARLLHITPRSVYNKLRRHRLRSPRVS
jgi:DNA-binding NtrC family response regulator